MENLYIKYLFLLRTQGAVILYVDTCPCFPKSTGSFIYHTHRGNLHYTQTVWLKSI